jgi:hypothetical protein
MKEICKFDGIFEVKTGFYIRDFRTGLNQYRILGRGDWIEAAIRPFKALHHLCFTCHVVSIGEDDKSHSIEKFWSQYRSQIVQIWPSTQPWEGKSGAASEKLGFVLPE